MVRNILFVILSIAAGVLSCHSHAQSVGDSLERKLNKSHGIQRAELLIELSTQTRQTDLNTAISQVDEARQIAVRLGNEKLEAYSLSKMGFYYSIQDRTSKALETYFQALALNRRNGFQRQEAAVLHRLGTFYRVQENYSKALDYYFQSIRIREEESDKKGLAKTLYFTGIIYDERGEFRKALDFYRQSYELSEETGYMRQRSMSAAVMGILYQERDSLEQALLYYQKALEAAEALNSSHAKATIMLHMSSVYQDKELFEEALKLNNKQIDIARAENSKFLEAQGLENLANLYHDQGNLERSNRYFRESKSIYQAIGYPESPVIITNSLARNLLQQGAVTEAIEGGSQALSMAQTIGSLEESRKALELLVKAYTEQENYHLAYQAQAQLTAVNDSLYNKEQEKQIAQMQMRYESEQKEQEIALLQKKHEKAQLMRYALIAGLILIVLIGLLIYNRQRLKIKKNRAELENTRLKEQKLKQDLEFKNKQLTTHSLHLVQKNETMKELKDRIGSLRKRQDGDTDRALQKLKNMVDYSFSLDEDWEQFRLYFEEVHTGFFDALKKQYPDLTANELRLSALVKLNLTSKEIATILAITSDSVKTARYRLRKKLDMDTEENLTNFMMNVEKEVSNIE